MISVKRKDHISLGKIKLAKENPHERTPNLSTLIILSHTKDGLEIAKEYKIPKVIQDIIVQHHGTTLVKYFYYTVKNNQIIQMKLKKKILDIQAQFQVLRKQEY